MRRMLILLLALVAPSFSGCIADFEVIVAAKNYRDEPYDVQIWINGTGVAWHGNMTVEPGSTVLLGAFDGRAFRTYTVLVQVGDERADKKVQLGRSTHSISAALQPGKINISELHGD